MNTIEKTTSISDIKLTWTNSIHIPKYLIEEVVNYDEFIRPYTLQVFDENDNLLKEYNNFKDGEKHTTLIQVDLKGIKSSMRRAYMFASPRKIYSQVVDNIKYIFTFPFDENVKSYYEKTGNIGFFKNIKIKVISEDGDSSNDAIINVSYPNESIRNIRDIFTKIFRISDGSGVKLKFNKQEFLNSDIQGALLEPLNPEIKERFKCIFLDNIKEKWADIIENETLLSFQFPNNYVLPNNQQLNFKIYYLNRAQVEIFNYYKNMNVDENKILEIFSEYLTSRFFEAIEIENEDNEYKIFYQNFLYLFNEESFNNIAWPTDKTLIDRVYYKKYFPLLKDLGNNTTCMVTKLINPQSSALVLSDNEQIPDTIGYQFKDLDENINQSDIKIDFSYQKNTNIQSIEVKNIINDNNNINLYLEIITTFTNYTDIKMSNITNNLSFLEKYYVDIDGQNYLTLLFKLNYNYSNTTWPEANKNQLLHNKEFISFSFDVS